MLDLEFLNEESNLSTFTSDASVTSDQQESVELGTESPMRITETGIIGREHHEMIPGRRTGSQLLYLKREKCLYTPVTTDKYGKRYKCFEKLCNARVLLNSEKCEKSKSNADHVDHNTHEKLRLELLALHKIKADCSNIDLLCGTSAQTVSVRSVFDNNVSECVERNQIIAVTV